MTRDPRIEAITSTPHDLSDEDAVEILRQIDDVDPLRIALRELREITPGTLGFHEQLERVYAVLDLRDQGNG